MDHFATTGVFPKEGETVLGRQFSRAPGGKGANQAVQCARLGAEVTMLGKVGDDAYGRELLEICKTAGIRTDRILVDPAVPTGCSSIIVEESPDGQAKNRIIVLPGANMTLKPEELKFLAGEIGGYDMVILQIEIPMEVNEQVAAYAAAVGVPVMLNPAPAAPLKGELLSRLTYISPNEHEAAALTDIPIPHEGSEVDWAKLAAASKKLRRAGVKNVLITLGDAGAVLDTGEGLHNSPCAPGVKAVDPTAAGDSFVASFCVGVASGMEVDAALRFANHTAALTVSRLGAMPSLPTLQEVAAAWPGVSLPPI